MERRCQVKMTPHGRDMLCCLVRCVPPLAWCLSFAHAPSKPSRKWLLLLLQRFQSSWGLVEPFLRPQTPMHVWESKCTACYGSGIVSFSSGRRGRRSSATCASCTGMGASLSPWQLCMCGSSISPEHLTLGELGLRSSIRGFARGRVCGIGTRSPTTSLSSLHPYFHPVYVKDFW